jgi:hypothetical protein
MRITAMTGVAEITEKRGRKKAAARLSSPEEIPAKTPSGTDIRIPRTTRKKVFPNERRNLSVVTMAANLIKTGSGPGKSRMLPEYREINSQRARRVRTPKRPDKWKYPPFRLFFIIPVKT